MNKKILVGIFALTIVLSTFVGLAMAAPKIKRKSLVLLGSYDGHFISESIGAGSVESSIITTDRPAIFTISVIVTTSDDPTTDIVDLNYQTTPTGSWAHHRFYGGSSEQRDLSITVAGYGVYCAYWDLNVPGLELDYCIIVQGESDTIVEIGLPS